MGRITQVCCAVAAFVISTACAFAQMMPNQIVSGAYTLYGFPPDVLKVSPNQVLTLFSTVLNVPDAVATQAPLPTTLSGVSVLVRVVGAQDATGYSTALPVLSIFRNIVGIKPSPIDCSSSANANSIYCANTAITVQIPLERVCVPGAVVPDRDCSHPPFSELPPMLLLNVSANGVTGPDLPVQVVPATPHFLNSCETVLGPPTPIPPGGPSKTCNPSVIHGDGSFVTTRNPAKVGETISLYATGLGVGENISLYGARGLTWVSSPGTLANIPYTLQSTPSIPIGWARSRATGYTRSMRLFHPWRGCKFAQPKATSKSRCRWLPRT